MMIDTRITKKRDIYDKGVNNINIFLILWFFLCYFFVKWSSISDIEMEAKFIVFMFLGLGMVLNGVHSFRSKIIGGIPPWFNYWVGTIARVSSYFLMLIGIIFIYIALKIVI
jgi:hypothetical protein